MVLLFGIILFWGNHFNRNKYYESRRYNMVDDRWLSVEEIAAYLGIKRETLYKWLAEKNMPAHKVGRLWKFRKDEVDEWVRTGEADSRKKS